MIKISKETYDKIIKIIGQCEIVAGNEEFVIIDDGEIEGIIEDLIVECHSKEERLEDEIQIREDFYQPKSPYEVYGLNERDFF